MPITSTRSSPSLKRRKRRSAPAAPKIITSAMRCRSYAPKDSYDCGLRSVECGLQTPRMTTQELKQRTFQFGVRVITAVEALPKSETGRILGRQLLRGAFRLGKYRAAARARSPADFVAKLGVVEEECDESAYWMEMILARKLLKRPQLSNLLTEANELLAITVASIKTGRRNRRK